MKAALGLKIPPSRTDCHNRPKPRLITSAIAQAVPLPPPEFAVSEYIRCPICMVTPLVSNKCSRCSRTYVSNETFTDLTLTSGAVYNPQQKWGGTELFRSPLISFVYERGWRQGFAWAGFPGVDKEFDLAMERLRPAFGKRLVDLSCGSGLFTRRFLSSNKFASVIAIDYSESMLRQTKKFIEEDTSLQSSAYSLIRADVARLPFATGSISAIHAGAALHCYPDPLTALAEISRVLAPGGVFVASTFLTLSAPVGQFLGNDALAAPLDILEPNPRAYKWWTEKELRDLCSAVGLTGFERERSGKFILFSASQPEAI